ncbi:GDSL esterase/lipase [Camellia lanceoleosa]|uniref:GDSL esterase/lipase n=1 Tax=Camellia lanceoleosa TaxID=1840588 RepID=A0ACC0HRH0_9ERIC|nr:GDSL esterase/lipase [Camellia lanceoleosa]
MQPLGCLPRSTVLNSFQECNATENTAVTFHNLLLQQAVSKLNNNSNDSSAFVILDLYGSFISVLKTKGDFLGSVKFETPLKPCCMGTSSGHYCGSLDEKGAKMSLFDFESGFQFEITTSALEFIRDSHQTSFELMQKSSNSKALRLDEG